MAVGRQNHRMSVTNSTKIHRMENILVNLLLSTYWPATPVTHTTRSTHYRDGATCSAPIMLSPLLCILQWASPACNIIVYMYVVLGPCNCSTVKYTQTRNRIKHRFVLRLQLGGLKGWCWLGLELELEGLWW